MNNYNSNNKAIIIFWILIAIAFLYIFISIKNNQPTLMVTYMDAEGIYAIEANIKKNSKVAPPKVEAREGYEFLGWFLDDVLFDFDTPITEDLYLKMKWFKTDTYEIEEISKEQEQIVKEEQETKKEEGTIKTQTNEEVKEEKENNPTPVNPTPTPKPVEEPKITSTIEFSSATIVCNKGSVAKATITSTNGIKSYVSNDTSVATIKDSATQPTCEGCKSIDITCNKVGISVITATNLDGIQAATNVVVKEMVPMTFTSKSITCKKGEVTSVIINGGDTTIKSYKSNNTNVVVLSEPSTKPDCTNCKELTITCAGEGEATIEAIGNDGTSVTSKVTVSLDKLKVSETSITCKKGMTRKLSITSGNNGVKSYTSSNTNVVTITKSDAQPKCLGCVDLDVRCIAAGTANIKVVANNGEEVTTKVSVSESVPISFNVDTISCKKGEVLTAILNGGDSGIKTYESSDTSIISVKTSSTAPSCSGCIALDITCVGAGEAKLTATANNGSTDEVKVTVSVDQLKLSPTSISCTKGMTKKLEITSGTNGVKTYTSSDSNIVSIAKSDTQRKCLGCLDLDVKCLKAGSASIKVVANNGETKSTSVTVKDTVPVSFDMATITCTKGEVKELTIKPGDVGIKSYASNNTNVVTVSDSTKTPSCTNCKLINVSCVGKGTATITATGNDGSKATSNVTVSEVVIDKLSVSPTTISCKKGDVKKISITSGNNGVKSYTSSNTNVVTVSKSASQPQCNGCVDIDVTCKDSGTSNIKVTANNGETKTVKVTVATDPTVIAFEPISVTCTKGETKSITVTASPSGVKSFASSNTSVATLTEGTSNCKDCKVLNISCVGAGTANINIEANDGVKANTTVTVNAPAPVVLTPYCTQGELRYNGNSPYCYVACGTEKYGCDVYSACASRQNTCKPGCSGNAVDNNGRCEYKSKYYTIQQHASNCVQQPDGIWYALFPQYNPSDCSKAGGSWDSSMNRCIGQKCLQDGQIYKCDPGWKGGGLNNPVCYRDYDLPCVTGSENECVPGYVYKENACERTKYCNSTDSSILKYR